MMTCRKRYDRCSGLILRTGAMIGLGFAGGGCEQVNCEEFRCHAAETALAQYFIDYVACCEHPEMAGCDGLDGRYDDLFLEIREGYGACLDRDWNRLKEIWEEIKRLRLLRNTVGDVLVSICHDVPLLMGENTAVVFSSEDTFAFECVFEPTDGPRPVGPWSESPEFLTPREGHPEFLHAPVLFQSTYACAPGSSLLVDTWLGKERLELTGELIIVHEPASLESLKCGVAYLRSFTLNMKGESIHARVACGLDEEGNWCVLDGEGGGVISGNMAVQLGASNLPGLQFEEIFGRRFQVNIPLAIRNGTLVCTPNGPIGGFRFLPPTAEAKAAYLHAVGVLDGTENLTGVDPCLEQGRQRIETLKGLFGSCYPPTVASTAD